MTKKISPTLTALAFGVLVLCFLGIFYVFAWTEPTATPPEGNVPAPLNVSLVDQSKAGRLTFTEFYDYNNPSYYVNPNGATSAILAGNVLIGTTTSPSNRRLDVRDGRGLVNRIHGAIFRGSNVAIQIGEFRPATELGYPYAVIQASKWDVSSTYLYPGDSRELYINPGGGRVGIGFFNSHLQDAAYSLDRPFKVWSTVPSIEGRRHTAIFIDSTQRSGVAIGGLNDVPLGSIQSARYLANTATPVFDVPLSINEAGGNVGIGMSNPPTKLSVANVTAATGGNTLRYYNTGPSAGGIYYLASSEKYKSDIQPFVEDFARILQIEPKSFVDNLTGQRNIGYIAEEIDQLGLKHLVGYDEEGRPETIDHNGILLYLLEVVKNQQEQIDILKSLLDK